MSRTFVVNHDNASRLDYSCFLILSTSGLFLVMTTVANIRRGRSSTHIDGILTAGLELCHIRAMNEWYLKELDLILFLLFLHLLS